MRSRSRITAAALVAVLALAATGSTAPAASVAQPGKGKPAVTIGDKNFTEEFILGELYSQALKAKGYTVKVKRNIGSSEIIDKALTSGQIDMYPEYTGTIVTVIAHNTKARPKTAAKTYAAAQAFESKRGFTLLNRTPFFDADGVAVKPAYAAKYGLKTIADLKKVPGKVRYGAPPENRTRFQGLLGMKQVYHLKNVDLKPLAIGLQYPALAAGKIDMGAIFTTDAALFKKYTVLTDPKGIFGFQNVAPVVSKKVLAAEGPQFAATLNAVSAKLTNPAIIAMNAAVDIDKRKPADVAAAFLKANGLS